MERNVKGMEGELKKDDERMEEELIEGEWKRKEG